MAATTAARMVAAPGCAMSDGAINITYRVDLNRNDRVGGWVPIITTNGRDSGSAWLPFAYDRDDALDMAKREAELEAEQYTGDWDITVKEQSQ